MRSPRGDSIEAAASSITPERAPLKPGSAETPESAGSAGSSEQRIGGTTQSSRVSPRRQWSAPIVRRAVFGSGRAIAGEGRLIDSSPEKASRLPAEPMSIARSGSPWSRCRREPAPSRQPVGLPHRMMRAGSAPAVRGRAVPDRSARLRSRRQPVPHYVRPDTRSSRIQQPGLHRPRTRWSGIRRRSRDHQRRASPARRLICRAGPGDRLNPDCPHRPEARPLGTATGSR
jgi:hypothetical protein